MAAEAEVFIVDGNGSIGVHRERSRSQSADAIQSHLLYCSRGLYVKRFFILLF